jgi:hypothetical protein
MELHKAIAFPLFLLPLSIVYPFTQIPSQTQKWLLLIPFMVYFLCFGLVFKFESAYDRFFVATSGVIVSIINVIVFDETSMLIVITKGRLCFKSSRRNEKAVTIANFY